MSIFSTFNMLTWKQTDAFTLTLTKYDHNNESAVEQRSFYVIWKSEEISMLKSCQYCQKIHDSKYNCHMKPVKKNHRTECDRFRYTSAWQQKREEIKERDRYLCQVCIRNLYGTTRMFNSNDLSVHHANKLNDAYEQRLDNNNLLTLCGKHHKMADDGLIPKEQILSIIREQNIHPPGCADRKFF